MTPEQEHLIDDILNLARPAGISPGAWAALRAMRDEWRAFQKDDPDRFYAPAEFREQWEKFKRSVEPVQVVPPPDPLAVAVDTIHTVQEELHVIWQRLDTFFRVPTTPLSRHENLAKYVEQISERLGVQERGWREVSERLLALERSMK